MRDSIQQLLILQNLAHRKRGENAQFLWSKAAEGTAQWAHKVTSFFEERRLRAQVTQDSEQGG